MKKDWEIKKLGEIALFRNGIAHEKEIEKNGKFIVVNSKFVSSNGAIRKYTNECLSPLFKDEIVFVMSDVPKGKTLAKCYIIDENNKYSLNQRICAFSDIKLDLKFFFYCLNRNKYFLSFDNGENQTNLRKNDILNCPFPVPPLEDQKRIVKILDEKIAQLETIKANAQTNLQNAKDLFQSQLAKAFNNTTWEKKRLGDVCEIRPSKSETTKYLSDDDNVSFLPMEDLQIMNYYIEPKQSKKLKEVSGSYTCFANGDVLLAKVTPCFENGKQGIAKDLTNGVGFGSSEYIVFRPASELLSEYLYYSLATSDFRENGKKHLLGACGLKRLSKDYVNEYNIPLPPLPEQKRIVKELDTLSEKVHQLQEIYTKQIANCDELKQAYLQKAFEGEL